MKRLHRRIQSPAALFAFEAAARHLSFTAAAGELNVSQPAVSLSIKKLEQALGTMLFERRHRTIHLTDAGERFYADVSFGLMHILNSAESVARRMPEDHVSISCSTAFAHYWMLPRLATFRRDNTDIEIRLQTTDKDIDIVEEPLSFAVRLGSGDWPGFTSFWLGPEKIYPVCSPAYLEKAGRPRSDADILGHELIHLEEPYRPRAGWRDWFGAQGIDYVDHGGGLRFNDYALVIQAAIAGEGVAYGWDHIVENVIKQGLLVRLGSGVYDVGQGHYVIWPENQPPGPKAERVLAWLRTQAKTGDR
ncbi:MAG: LysR family transcriptional regulator [Hyphomicrobiales bacterium]|nr:LysR family transcriptional regulator [Hyphomicrobiales bacterium]MCP4999833.1 LysR family transcriptional regulator [Hyphomicrobiales bacterium]